MHTLSFNDIKMHIPGNWNELNRDQLLSFASIVRDNMELEEIKVKMLFLFTKIKVLERDSVKIDNIDHFWLKYGKKKFLVSAYSLAFIARLNLVFFRETQESRYIVYSLLTRNLISVIDINGKKLHGPADGLSNILLKEYIHAETFYTEYFKTNSENALNNLIAVLYRPAGKTKPDSINFSGDLREPFNDFLTETYAQITRKITPDIKRAVLWYYEGCKRHIANLFPKVFKEGNGESSSDKNIFMQFMTIVDELANNQPAENERIMNVYLYTALNSLNQRLAKIPKNVKV
jgi:hypothetical protein